jgi:nitrogen fixation protein
VSTPLLVALVVALIGLVMLGREARRVLQNDFRYLSNPKEARRSALAAAAIGLVLLIVAGGLFGLLAGLSRYMPVEDGPTPAVIVSIEAHRSGGWRISFPEHPPNVTMGPMRVEGEWFSIVADKVAWRGPLRWAGFRDALRPCALIATKRQEDIANPAAIVRLPISADNQFERWVAGPLSRIGVCTFTEIRTPWRPVRPGSREYLFSAGGAVAVPGTPGAEGASEVEPPPEREASALAPRL